MTTLFKLLLHFLDATLEGTGWKFDDELKMFSEELDEVASKIRMAEMEKATRRLQKFLQVTLTENIAELLLEAAPDMWSRVMKLYRSTVDKAKASFISSVSGKSHDKLIFLG